MLVIGVHETADLEFGGAEVLVGSISSSAPAGLGACSGIEPSHDSVNFGAITKSSRSCSDPIVISEEKQPDLLLPGQMIKGALFY